MSRRRFLVFTLGAILVLFVSVNAFAGVVLRGARLDLTADRLYALSRGSQQIVAGLAEPVDLTFYFSRGIAQDYPSIRAYGARVRETLLAIAARSRGKLRLEIIDPEPFSEDEDRAIADGVRAVPTGDGRTLYFGLVARNALDETSVAPFFNPELEPYLEYELMRIVSELNRAEEIKVALISSLPLETRVDDPLGGGPEVPQPIYAYAQLLADFEVDTLDRDFVELPDDADILVIAHPWELDPAQLWAIDQFVLAHGRAVVLLDPYSLLALEPGPTGFPDIDAVRTSNLEPLLAAWGVSYDPRRVVLDRANALAREERVDGRAVDSLYPVWFEAPPEQLSNDDLATTALRRGLRFAMAGALEPLGPDVAFEPLVTTSEDARAIDLDDAVEARSGDLLDGYAPEGRFTLAARVSGAIATAFPDRAPEGVRDPDEPILSGRAEIIVAADSDLLNDALYVAREPLFEPTALRDNAAFVLNAVDLLIGDDALVGLRSRGRSERPMTLIDDMRAGAELALRAERDQLETRLAAAEDRLAALQEETGAIGAAGEAASEAADAELQDVVDEMLATRARLREIERSYRVDIERLEAAIIFLNVWLLPMLVAAFGVAVFVLRRRAAHAGAGGAA